MKLKQLETSDIELVSSWLSKKECYKWLDFGIGVQQITPQILKLMMQRKIHQMRLFTTDDSDEPIGLVALSDINPEFRTAVLWFALGDLAESGKRYTSRAVAQMLAIGYNTLHLNSIFAWTLENNLGSIKIINYNNFKYLGRRRQCHYINGKAYDRLLYDLLKSEYQLENHDE